MYKSISKLTNQIEAQSNAKAFKRTANEYTKNIDAIPLTAISQSRSPPVISETNIIRPAHTNKSITATTGKITMALNNEIIVSASKPPRIKLITKTNIPPTNPQRKAFNIASSIFPSATIREKKYFGRKNISVNLENQFLFFAFIFCTPWV